LELEILLNEVELETKDKQLNILFDRYLSQVFSENFKKKIDEVLRDKISFKEVVDKNRNVVAYTIGNVIHVNTPVFYSKNINKAILFVLHEFIHILQNSKSFFIVNKFSDIKNIENQLYSIVQKSLTKPYSVFLTGKQQPLHSSGKDEVLTYQMNGSIDWSALKPEAKEEYINILKQSGIFNLGSRFWKKRLS
jgi:hypothetical protein